MLTIDIEKAKQALATLETEKQEQKDRLMLAKEAKKMIENPRSTLCVSC